MVGFLVKVLSKVVLLNVVEHRYFDDVERLAHDFTQSTSVRHAALGLVFLRVRLGFRGSVLAVALFNELHLQDGAIAIVHIGEAVGAAGRQLFVDVVVVVVIGRCNV